MHVARHGVGVRPTLAALGSQVHPVFMLPPLAASLYGAVLAGRLAPLPAALHVAAMFFAVYTAHVKDGYVDFHVRDEDDDHPMTAAGCRLALAGSSVLFAAATLGLASVASVGTALLAVPAWVIAYNHAPTLDVHAVTTTLGYPTGIALSILGGFHAQVGYLAPDALASAAVFLVLLAGVKVIDDAQDYEYDRSIQKRTVAVVLGPNSARRFAYAILALALLATLFAVLAGIFPPGAGLAAVAFGLVAAIAWRADVETATMLLVRGAYVYLALLVTAVWFRPLG